MQPIDIRRTVDGYLNYLDEGGERIILPRTERIHYPGLVHASNLMDCPLRARKERNKEEPYLPELMKRNNPTLLLRMLQGERIAEILQEAFVWNTQEDIYGISCIPEYSVVSQSLKLQGRLDIFVEETFNKYISSVIEIKHRLPTWKDKTPMPRAGDIAQLFAYKLMTNAEEAHLIIVNTPAYKEFNDPTRGYFIWTLYEDAEVPGDYILQDENFDVFYDFPGVAINQEFLEKEIQRQLRYLNGVNTPPIDLGSNEAWQCKSNVKLAKDGNIGVIEVKCPFWCHSNNPSPLMDYYYDDQGVFQLVDRDF